MASELQKLKKKLDNEFSRYIRLKYSTSSGTCTCYTCGRVGVWNSGTIHCGHYIPRNILATRFDEHNTRPQCVGCNLYGNGAFVDFRINLVAELGEDVVKELEGRKKQVFKVDQEWYKEKIEYYKQEVKRLLSEKDVKQENIQSKG